MTLSRLLLRTTLGGLFIGHGAQKLFGAFGGHGLEAAANMFESLGLRPGKAQATLAGAAEVGGGLGVLAGYRTPLSAAALIATMVTAIDRVHGKNGPWITEGGYEYNLMVIVAAATLAELGPGGLSLDALRGRQPGGLRCDVAALGLGVGGALGARVITEQLLPAPVSPAPADAGPGAETPADA
jgi:putative oxidoreductase